MRKEPEPSRRPHMVTAISDTDGGWFYEGKAGIEVIAIRDHVTTGVRIPWSMILKAAARCGVA